MSMQDLIQWCSTRLSAPSRHRADQFIEQGNRHEDKKELEAALASYRLAVRTAPGYPRAHLNEGNALSALGREREALVCFRKAIHLDADYAFAYFNLGATLQKLKQTDDAIAAFEAALRCNPALAEAHVALGGAWIEGGMPDEMIENHYRAAIALQPDRADAHFGLGSFFKSKRKPDEAIPELKMAVESSPTSAAYHRELGDAYGQAGYGLESAAEYVQARQLDPDNYMYHSIALFNMNFHANVPDETYIAEHIAYGKQYGSGFSTPETYPNDRTADRRLRIGYVSGDFRLHPVLRFLDPLLERHDRRNVEIYCYATRDKTDAGTERIKALTDHWREVADTSDDEMAALIRQDRIDILVDLSGHTGDQRLAVFARKPAPVQATWLGYLGTTGLDAMDYRICDSYTDPPGLTEWLHTEKLARLPDCQWCYRPGLDIVPSPPPMIENGYPTFGSFNNILKLNERVLGLWADLLLSVPTARLLITAMPESKIAKQRIEAIFERHGVAPERLAFRPRSNMREYLTACQEADIALDPFPYNGGTTSIDILYAGTPIVTLAGTRSIARGGVSLLSNLGLPQFIANSEQEYVAIAKRWAESPVELAALRASLPERLRASPMCDETRFARNMETLYREMWTMWLRDGRQPRGR